MAEKGKKKDESEKFVKAVLNIDLRCHCVGCIRNIRKTCLSLQGVTTVDVNANKVNVSGIFDPVTLRDKLQSSNPKKKVELVSPAPPKKSDSEAKSKGEQEKSKNEKEPAVATVVLKMALHCEGCTQRIQKLISTSKGVLRVEMDKEKELITVVSTAEPKQLAELLQKKLKRRVEILPEKKGQEKDQDKKQKQQNEGGKKGGGNGDKGEQSRDPKMEYFMVGGGGYGYREAASGHVVDVLYAPQIFSEDNANGCSLM